MNGSGTKVLVCYVSGTGCTKGVAERIGDTLSRSGLSVDVSPIDAKPDPARYDAIVAGSGIRAGQWQPAAKKWLARNATVLGSKPLVLFSVGIALAHGPEKADEMRGYTKRLLEKTGLEPLDLGVFAGWYELSKFSFLERKVMDLAKAPEGDHRDWAAIEGWAQGLAPRLSQVRVAVA